MIRITSKKAGFRRCGMPHPKQPVDYPDDRFSEEEIEVLKAEPMLIVELDLEEPKSQADTEEDQEESPSRETDESPEEPARHASPQGEAGGSAPIETGGPDFEEWTVKELTAELEARGIEIPKKARKAELIDLIKTV